MNHPELEKYISEMHAAMHGLPRARRKVELAEMRSHVEQLFEEAGASGLDDNAAMEKVREQFGDPADIGGDVAASWTTRPHVVIRFLLIYAMSVLVIFGFLHSVMDKPDDLWNTTSSQVRMALLMPLAVLILRSAHRYRMRLKLRNKLES